MLFFILIICILLALLVVVTKMVDWQSTAFCKEIRENRYSYASLSIIIVVCGILLFTKFGSLLCDMFEVLWKYLSI